MIIMVNLFCYRGQLELLRQVKLMFVWRFGNSEQWQQFGMGFSPVDSWLHELFNPKLDMEDVRVSHAKFAILKHHQNVEVSITTDGTIVSLRLPVSYELVLGSKVEPPVLKDDSPIFPIPEADLVLDFAAKLSAGINLFE